MTRTMKIAVPEYSAESGFRFEWEAGFEIGIAVASNEVVIRANPAGLVSLARHLLALADSAVPAGCHIHLDEYNSLDDGSTDLIVERT